MPREESKTGVSRAGRIHTALSIPLPLTVQDAGTSRARSDLYEFSNSQRISKPGSMSSPGDMLRAPRDF